MEKCLFFFNLFLLLLLSLFSLLSQLVTSRLLYFALHACAYACVRCMGVFPSLNERGLEADGM
jgi:hypothetical protein